MPAPLRLEDHVVPLTAEVLNAKAVLADLLARHPRLRRPSLSRVLPPPLRVEVGHVRFRRLIIKLVVEVEIEVEWVVALALHLEARSFDKGHREVAVKALTVLRRHRQRE